MLDESKSNSDNMADTIKHKLSIHRSNLFRPKPFRVKHIAKSLNGEMLAVIKDFTNADQDLSILEIYRIRPNPAIKLLNTLIEQERLTGVEWIDDRSLITTSLEQTINTYSIDSSKKEASFMTDYGAITSMKYSHGKHILVTGTEYGYVVVYNINPFKKTVETLNKMVKITGKINSVDFTIKQQKNKSKVKKTATPMVPPKAKKRKHTDSDEESEPDAETVVDSNPSSNHLDNSRITLYGACENNVVCWDYHEKRILETLRVGDEACKAISVLALGNGDLIVGDSSGTASWFDHLTYTCRQNINIFQSGILCMSKNDADNHILVAGQDSAIHLLKRDKVEDEFVLSERIESHSLDINAIVLVNSKEFITGSLDGRVTRFLVERRKTNQLIRVSNLHSYTNNIKFSNSEMMIQYDNSLVIWKLPKSASESDDNIGAAEPVKLLLIKTKAFIHSSTFNDQWICYSTKKTLNMFYRAGEKLVSRKPNKAITCCNELELCLENKYLAASNDKTLYVVGLEGCSEDDAKCPIIGEKLTKSKIQQMLYIEACKTLVLSCGPFPSFIYTIDLDPYPPAGFSSKLELKANDIAFLTDGRYCKNESSFFAYTRKDKILRLVAPFKDEDILAKINAQPRVNGLPKEANILGMVVLSDDTCILYNECHMFKVDMNTSTVINQIARYRHIVAMNNCVFGNATEVSVVELTPEDYWASFPHPVNQRKKFGR